MKQLLFLVIVATIACCIKVSQNSAYNVLQNEISSLNSENEANQKTMSKMRSTLKQMMNEMRDMKWSNMNAMNTNQQNSNPSPAQPRAASTLSKSDEERLKNIMKMANEIVQHKTNAAKKTPTRSNVSSANAKATAKEVEGLNQLAENVKIAKKSMNNKNVQREEKDTEASLKSEMKRYRRKLEKLDAFAVRKIEKHQRNHHFPKTIEEKNLNRRKRYIAMREKQTLEELNKKEMELRSVTPSFQGTMKDSLLAIFKNEDRQRQQALQARTAAAAAAATPVTLPASTKDAKPVVA